MTQSVNWISDAFRQVAMASEVTTRLRNRTVNEVLLHLLFALDLLLLMLLLLLIACTAPDNDSGLTDATVKLILHTQ